MSLSPVTNKGEKSHSTKASSQGKFRAFLHPLALENSSPSSKCELHIQIPCFHRVVVKLSVSLWASESGSGLQLTEQRAELLTLSPLTLPHPPCLLITHLPSPLRSPAPVYDSIHVKFSYKVKVFFLIMSSALKRVYSACILSEAKRKGTLRGSAPWWPVFTTLPALLTPPSEALYHMRVRKMHIKKEKHHKKISNLVGLSFH